MASLAAETSQLSLNSLDLWERRLRIELWDFKQRTAARRWTIWKKPTAPASWLDLCNGDGFKREDAMRSLADGAPNGFFFALALRRLNDWVPQVRTAARMHLPRMAERSDPEHVAEALWHALPHWMSWGRMKDADRQVLSDLVGMKSIALIFKARIQQATTGPVAQILAQAGRTQVFDEWLGEFSSTAIQPAVRAKAFRFLLDGRMTWLVGRKWVWTDVRWCEGRLEPVLGERPLQHPEPFLTTLKRAIADRSSLVRRVAAEYLIRRLDSIGDEAQSIAMQLASDSCHYIAERCRFALASIHAIEVEKSLRM
ncbi:hypothetical protein [Hylemonella gracilis]|nr:hypothetical protein [Hylemonella gracilis]